MASIVVNAYHFRRQLRVHARGTGQVRERQRSGRRDGAASDIEGWRSVCMTTHYHTLHTQVPVTGDMQHRGGDQAAA